MIIHLSYERNQIALEFYHLAYWPTVHKTGPLVALKYQQYKYLHSTYLNGLAFCLINIFADIYVNNFLFHNFFISSLIDSPPFNLAIWVRSCQWFLVSRKVVVITIPWGVRCSVGQSQKARHCQDNSLHSSRGCGGEMMPDHLELVLFIHCGSFFSWEEFFFKFHGKSIFPNS